MPPTPTHADKIPLSELKEHYWAVFELPTSGELTRRQLLKKAVHRAKLERSAAAAYEPLTDAEWAALHTPVVATDGEECPL